MRTKKDATINGSHVSARQVEKMEHALAHDKPCPTVSDKDSLLQERDDAANPALVAAPGAPPADQVCVCNQLPHHGFFECEQSSRADKRRFLATASIGVFVPTINRSYDRSKRFVPQLSRKFPL